MKFRPLHDRVLVKRIEGDEKSSGGIIKTISRGHDVISGEVDLELLHSYKNFPVYMGCTNNSEHEKY